MIDRYQELACIRCVLNNRDEIQLFYLFCHFELCKLYWETRVYILCSVTAKRPTANNDFEYCSECIEMTSEVRPWKWDLRPLILPHPHSNRLVRRLISIIRVEIIQVCTVKCNKGCGRSERGKSEVCVLVSAHGNACVCVSLAMIMIRLAKLHKFNDSN